MVSVRRVPVWAQAGLLAVVYFAAAKLSLLLAIPPGYATAVWPPSGIALAAMLALGNRVWPGVWVGAALVNLTVESSWLASALIGTGNTLEALAGATLIRRFIGVPYRFERGEEVVKFIALSALSATLAATIGVVPLVFGHTLPSSQILPNWWARCAGLAQRIPAPDAGIHQHRGDHRARAERGAARARPRCRGIAQEARRARVEGARAHAGARASQPRTPGGHRRAEDGRGAVARKRNAFSPGDRQRHRLRHHHAGPERPHRELECRGGANQGLSRRRDHRPAFFPVLSSRGRRARQASIRTGSRLRRGALRGRRLALAQGR